VSALELERRRSFALIADDHAAYVVADGAGAVAMAHKAGTVAVDTETQGLDRDRWALTAVIIATDDLAYVLDPVTNADAIRGALKAATELAFFNATFDVPVLIANGLMRLGDIAKVYDVLISARLANPAEDASRDLARSCFKHLGPGYERAKRQARESWRRSTNLPKAEMYRRATLASEPFASYAGFDGIMTARLRAVIDAAVADRFAEHPFPYTGDAAAIVEREQVVNRMLIARSARGLDVNLDAIDQLEHEFTRRHEIAVETLAEWGIDGTLAAVTVKRDAVDYLEAHGFISARHPRLQSGAPSAAATALVHIDHPLGAALREWAQTDRWVRDYATKVKTLTRAGRIHPEIAVGIAATGRMSYKAPPLQQYPEELRRIFEFPMPATSLDWSSIEPVVFANLAGEEALYGPYEAGGDVYAPVVAAAGVDRPTAKTTLLAQCYGQGARALAGRLGMTVEATTALITRTLGPFEHIRKAKTAITRIGDHHGMVQTISGRLVLLERDYGRDDGRWHPPYKGYKGIASTIQGSCYDLLAEAMCAMHRAGLDDALYAAVHDELVVDAAAADDVERIMLTAPTDLVRAAGRTPVLRTGRVELGRTWRPKK